MSLSYQQNLIKQAYKDKATLIHILETIDNEAIFTDKTCAMLWKLFTSVYREGFGVNHSTISDIIKFSGDISIQQEFDKIISSEYENESEWKYHMYVLCENYRKSLLSSMSDTIVESIDNSSSDEIIGEITPVFIDLQTSEIKTVSIIDACYKSYEEIDDINEGRRVSFLKTGCPEFDSLVSISRGKFILISAGAKIGKTRYVIDLISKLITNNDNIFVQWDTFEMTPNELVKGFISRQTQMSTYKLDGKGGKMKDYEMEQIKNASNYISKYPIEFIGDHLTITSICAKFIKFCGLHKNATNILIIDNLAYIKMDIKDQGQFEDNIAKSLVELRDKTNGIIILIHHLTKEVDSKWNKETGYEPKLAHIRGSKRLVDCPNQIILLHRPDFYSDLVAEDASCVGLFLAFLEVNRDGKTGVIKYQHQIDYSIFTELE